MDVRHVLGAVMYFTNHKISVVNVFTDHRISAANVLYGPQNIRLKLALPRHVAVHTVHILLYRRSKKRSSWNVDMELTQVTSLVLLGILWNIPGSGK